MILWLSLLALVGCAALYWCWLVKIFIAKKTTTVPKQATKPYDKAIVYIWLSQNRNHAQDSKFGHVLLEILKYEYDKVKQQHEFVPGSYRQNTCMSLGPADYPPRSEQILEQLRPHFVDNYRDDLIYEEGPPDWTFYFHSIHVGSMESRIRSIKEQKAMYGLLGSITFGCQTDTTLKRLASWIIRILVLCFNKWLLFIPIVKAFCSRHRVLPSSATRSHSYSCVSSVFDIFDAGMGVSKLLGFSDELLTSLCSSKEASKESVESSKEQELKKVLEISSFGYLTEATISPVIIISPDIFADFMKQVKSNEIKLYNVPVEKNRFKEENIKIKNVEHNFETEEWLPSSSDIERKNFGYNLVLFESCS